MFSQFSFSGGFPLFSGTLLLSYTPALFDLHIYGLFLSICLSMYVSMYICVFILLSSIYVSWCGYPEQYVRCLSQSLSTLFFFKDLFLFYV